MSLHKQQVHSSPLAACSSSPNRCVSQFGLQGTACDPHLLLDIYTLTEAIPGAFCFWKGVPVPAGGCSLPCVNSGVSRSGFPKTGLLQHSESFQSVLENSAQQHTASQHTPGKPTTVGRTTSRPDCNLKISHTYSHVTTKLQKPRFILTDFSASHLIFSRYCKKGHFIQSRDFIRILQMVLWGKFPSKNVSSKIKPCSSTFSSLKNIK